MKRITIHPQLHDVFGREQGLAAILSILLGGAAITAGIIYLYPPEYTQVAYWRYWIAFAIIFDIAAGVIANFTRSTNDYYVANPRKRWIFIAVHVHIIVIALLLDQDLWTAFKVWAFAMIFTSFLHQLKSPSAQKKQGAFLLLLSLVSLYFTSDATKEAGRFFIVTKPCQPVFHIRCGDIF